MNKGQKQVAMVAGGAVLLYLLYRWYQNNQAGSSTAGATGTSATNPTSSDYASLAGQEQGDVAALQGQNTQLSSQEQADVAGLGGQIAGLTSQENSDVTGLTGQLSGFANQFDQLTSGQNTLQQEIAALGTGSTAVNRASTANIQTHRGGPFYNYYVSVTGHAPPASVLTSNFVYQAWKSGVKAGGLEQPARHPSSKNTQIAHPNGNHTEQTHTKPASSQKPAQPKTTAPANKKAPAKPPAKTKPKAPAKKK